MERRGKISDTIRKALGNALVINEAHQLKHFATKQLDPHLPDVPEALADVMNKPEFQRKVLVILAGLKRLLDPTISTAVPRIAKKFGTRIEFHTWNSRVVSWANGFAVR